MPPKGGKSRGRGVGLTKKRKANPLSGEMEGVQEAHNSQEERSEEPVESQQDKELVPEKPMSEGGNISDAGSTTSNVSCRDRRKKKKEEEKKDYPWKDEHKDLLAHFFGQHEVFYDKSLKLFKDRAYKLTLCESFVQDTFVIKFPADPIPSADEVLGFYKNYRDRWVKINKKKSGKAAIQLTASDKWIKENFAFVEPHIRRIASVTSQTFDGVKKEVEEVRSSDSDAQAPDGTEKGIGKGCSRGASSSSRETSAASVVRQQGSTGGYSESEAMMSQVMNRLDDLVSHRKSREHPISGQGVAVQSFAQYLQTMMQYIPEGGLWNQYQLEAIQLVMRYQSRSRQQQLQCDQQYGQYAQQQFTFRGPQPLHQLQQCQPQFQHTQPEFQHSQQFPRPTQLQSPPGSSTGYQPLISSTQQPSPATTASTALTPLQSTPVNPFCGQSGNEDPDLTLSGFSNVCSLSSLLRAATETVSQGSGNTTTLNTSDQSTGAKDSTTQ